ncbi:MULTISPECIES: hemerythrin domain-containing protein [unclassified Thioalkalivibrio]|uniref:hemerythrin domain-containing protein n=1 Tax=unclassified Thioalkalivibrio TaxID=2621013 RepID=UPI00036726D2|nr:MULTISPECIES: hemerythrin domain-containing protein [unclassified Thioalkalivibrio]
MKLHLQEPAPGFHRPIELLRACHRRITNCLDTMERLSGHIEQHGADAEAQSAARRVLAYFEQAAPQHHADEDQDLFPILQAYRDHPEAHPQLGEWMDRLSAEHPQLEAGWDALEPALQNIAAGHADPLEGATDWIQRYRAHLELEEQAVLPLAEHLLNAEERARIGRSMAHRRGIPDAYTEPADE